MISVTTLSTRLQGPLPASRPHCEKLRRALMRVAASIPSAAALRINEILFKTMLAPLASDLFEAAPPTTETTDIAEVWGEMVQWEKQVKPAFAEVSTFMPKETMKLLRDLYTKQAPLPRLGVMIYLVFVAAVEDLLP